MVVVANFLCRINQSHLTVYFSLNTYENNNSKNYYIAIEWLTLLQQAQRLLPRTHPLSHDEIARRQNSSVTPGQRNGDGSGEREGGVARLHPYTGGIWWLRSKPDGFGWEVGRDAACDHLVQDASDGP